MNFQGKVVNSNGTNVTDGTYSFVFKLYSASSGGSALWTETDSLSVTAGVFQVNLGAAGGCPFFTANACNGSTPIDFSASNSLYLGITFNSDPAGEMSPRVQLQSVPYAFYADNAGSLGGRAASGYVQLSPGSQQTGFINVSGNSTIGGTLTVSSTINTATISGGTLSGSTLSSSGLTFSAASTATIQPAASQTLNITGHAASTFSTDSGNLTIQAGSGTVTLGSSTIFTNSTGGLAISAGGTTQNLTLDAATTGVVKIAGTSTGGVEIGGSGTGDILLGGGSGSTGCTVTNSTGAFTCTGNINSTTGAINTGAGAGTTRITNGGNLTNIGTVSAASGSFLVDANGNQTGLATAVGGVTSTTNGTSGLGTSTSLTLASAASFTVGDYVQINDTNCGGTGINPCYAKITAKATNTLTITPALTWTSGKTVNEYLFPEIGGSDVVTPTLTARYGRGWFISGVATGNGTTYYNEDGISTSLPTYNIAADSTSGATTINIGNTNTTTINIGSSSSTTNFLGAIATSNNGNISAGSGALQGGSLSINSGAFAVNSSGTITAGSANTSLLTAGTLVVARGGTGLSSFTQNAVLYASSTSAIGQLTGTSGQILLANATGVPGFANLGGDVASVDGTGLVTLANTAVASGSYGTSSAVATFTVDSKGRLTAASTTTLANTALQNSSITISNGTNISGGSTVSLGGTVTLSVINNPTFSGLVQGQSGLTITGGLTSLTATGSTDALNVNSGSSSGNIAVFKSNGTAVFTIANAGTVNQAATLVATSGSNGDANYLATVSPSSAPSSAASYYGLLGSTTAAGANINSNVSVIGFAGNAASTSSGTLGSGTGVLGEAFTGGTITTVNGFSTLIANTGSGTFAKVSGLNVATPAAGSGAITTDYGVQIQAQKGTGITTAYGLYQAGASDLNWFAGNVSLGATSAPTTIANPLQVGTTGQFTVSSTGAITAATGVTTTGDITGSGRVYLSHTTSTNGQGYFIRNATPTPIASFQGLDTGTNSFGFFGVNKYYNGTAWVDDGQSRVGSSFQIQDNTFNFYQFDTAANFHSRLVLNASGNVGIGQDVSPSYLLDVQGGDINTSANVRTAGTIRLDNAGNLTNIGNITGTAALTLDSGSTNALGIGTGANAKTITIGNVTGATGLVFNSGTAGVKVNTVASGQVQVTSGSNAPTVDQLNVTNAGSTGVATAGVNAFSINYVGGAGAIEAGAQRIDLQPGTTSGATWNGLRVVPNATGAATGVTENGIKVDNLTTPGAGTENALFVGTGWDNVLKATNSSITQAGLLTAVTINATTAYQANGTAGQTFTCGNNTYVNSAVLSEGILTGHSACTSPGLSDQRLKTNIVPLADSLDAIKNVNTVNFNFDCSNTYFANTDTYCDPNLQTGVIAQELQQIFPDLVNQNEFGYYTVNYQGLAVETLKATSELAEHINSAGDATFNNLTVNGTLTYASTSTDNGTFTNSVVTPQLLSNGALSISSGSAGDVAIDSQAGAVNIGTNNASQVNISRVGATTDVKGALQTDGDASFNGNVSMHFSTPTASFTVDNSNATQPLAAAIQVSDTSGQGYQQVIKTPHFSVAGDGSVSTDGTIVTRGGSFQLLDASGNNLVSFDQTGNATFAGNLNFASATASGGLTIGGDLNVGGLSSFQKLATFFAKTIFRQDVEFDGHISVSKDSAGYALLHSGESTVHVTFTTPYSAVPIVSASPADGQFEVVTVNNVTEQGFDITLKDPATADTKLSWTATGVIDPQTASNPPPANP